MNIYRTSDLWLASYLSLNGLRLIDKEKEGNKYYFLFQDNETRKKLVEDYFNNASVNILDLKASINNFKALIYNH